MNLRRICTIHTWCARAANNRLPLLRGFRPPQKKVAEPVISNRWQSDDKKICSIKPIASLGAKRRRFYGYPEWHRDKRLIVSYDDELAKTVKNDETDECEEMV